MNLDGIREALHRKPFVPFSISLADGRSFDVRHPEFVGVGQRLVTVIVTDDIWSVIEPLLIVSLDYVSPSGNQTNGTRRPRKS